MLTDYQAQYYSLQLTRRRASDDSEKLSSALIDAKVDLNPHQIEAALFAFKSPLSNGAILADEVGLGKTIEAGILLSQFWASNKRRLLIICPSSLRRQWAIELEEKFYLESMIFESKRFKELHAAGKQNPLERKEIVICSFHFASAYADYVAQTNWDLVVIDEAHRLRNVYRPSNKMGKTIKEAIKESKKILLTATPLQNSLLELYGLTSIIDEHVFGNIESFRSQFVRQDDGLNYQDLKERMRQVVHRTLRKQVREHVPWTERRPITIKFKPTPEEQELYENVSEYLQRELLHSMPQGKRHLITLIVRKLLASSSFAVTKTLEKLIKGVELVLEEKAPDEDYIATLFDDIDEIEDLEEEWDSEEATEDILSYQETEAIKSELVELKSFRDLAVSIEHNAKGEKLATALEQGFTMLNELGAQRKAIIFTESRRTQEYLFEMLNGGVYKSKVMLFNGSNNDPLSKQIYQSYKQRNAGTDKLSGSRTADTRQALVEHFKNKAEIMIATEAASEGINLQFCSMVINYDLPWNPQRIEQRIGRCHRYGQKHDVVVVNFLNIANAADQRVFQLLDQKFKLFDGVFGASDEVLGALESGVNFEQKIAKIYGSCRSNEEIEKAFDELTTEFQEQIDARIAESQDKLLEHFDADVIEKLRIRLEDAQISISRFQRWLWLVTETYLRGKAKFDPKTYTFQLQESPFDFAVKPGIYSLDKKNEQARRYGINHPLANGILKHYGTLDLPTSHLEFRLSSGPKHNEALSAIQGHSGWLDLHMVEVNSLEETDHLLFTAMSDDGEILAQEQISKMMDLEAEVNADTDLRQEVGLTKAHKTLLKGLRAQLQEHDSRHLQQEVNKLNRWAEDRVLLLEKEIHDTKKRIKALTRDAGKTLEPLEQLSIQKKIRALEIRQRKQRQQIFTQEDKIQDARDKMITKISKRLDRSFKEKHIFTLRWTLN